MPDTIDWMQKRDHWIVQVSALIDDIATWCEKRGWSVSRSNKSVSEEYIGKYEVPCLTIHAPSVRLHIDPMGLNIIGAEGRVDILAYPSLNRLLLVRKDDCWTLFTESRVPWPQEWGEDTFPDIVESFSAQT